MRHKINRKEAFREIRLIIYIVIVINGIYIQFFTPFYTLCDRTEDSCILCGMRQAISKLLMLDFYGAYNSNPGIVVILIFVCIMLIDLVLIIKGGQNFQYLKIRNDKSNGSKIRRD